MILDRTRLAQYIGVDASFEAQYLTLLAQTIQTCMESLVKPTSQTYGALHAAKPGLMVATTLSFSEQFSSACDRLMLVSDWPLSDDVALKLIDLHAQLEKLFEEIQNLLKAQSNPTSLE
jgi:hypothetical protein